ncbi:MAG: hypothetical protein HC915_19475 [Anaerolineae bacterium]|nr:hypothetical protein [Anaerolineae bacterium]
MLDDFSYMDAMIAAGLLEWVDCVGAQHLGYNLPPDTLWDAVRLEETNTYRAPLENPHPSWSFRSTLISYANKIGLAGYTTPLCLTEFGWASARTWAACPLRCLLRRITAWRSREPGSARRSAGWKLAVLCGWPLSGT